MTDEIVIRFTAAQLDCVANALGQRPYIEAAPVLDMLRQQVAQQQLPIASNPAPIDPPSGDAAPLQ